MSRGHREPSQRQLRVGEELRHAIAAILERDDIRDPDVAGRAITVTEVSVSPDLSHATVFVVPLGGGDSQALIKGLKRVRSYIRHALASMVQLRVVPDLVFAPDVSFERSSRIEALLNSPLVRRDLEQSDPPEPNPSDG
ncbi:MAG TPA: 30S ribosome-binding factor RbfA [Rhodospirillaceae bacterium]|nr:30S ribosome-binding factor RbfA [Rhodospirillaceae bacterium]